MATLSVVQPLPCLTSPPSLSACNVDHHSSSVSSTPAVQAHFTLTEKLYESPNKNTQVFKAVRNVPFPHVVAVKLLHHTSRILSPLGECNALHSLRGHPHIITMMDFIQRDESHFVLVMEYMEGGTLLRYVQSQNQGLSETATRPLFRQLVAALEHAHSLSIIHRDIKLENILLDITHTQLKLTDWGFATTFHPKTPMTHWCGSLHYASPEVVLRVPYFGPEVDAWALGVCLYIMASGMMPFYAPNNSLLCSLISVGHYDMPSHFSPSLRTLIKSILTPVVASRATVREIQSSAWLNANAAPPSHSRRGNPGGGVVNQ